MTKREMPCGIHFCQHDRKLQAARPQLLMPMMFSYFGLWQDPAIAQCAQLQPQEDFPFFLSLTSLRIIAATIRMSTKDTMIVLRLSVIQFNILTDSFHPICFVCSAYIIHRRGFFQTGSKKIFDFIT